jgi:hypothetical protein
MAFKDVLEPNQLAFQRVLGALPPEVKWPGRESVAVQLSYRLRTLGAVLSLPIRFYSMVLSLVTTLSLLLR